MITRNCDWCNTEYTARSTRGKTCSRKCSDDLYNSSKRDNSKRKHYRTCITCSKDFATASGSRERCLDCSDKIKSDRELIKDVKLDVKDSKRAVSDALKSVDDCLKLLDRLCDCEMCGSVYYKTNGIKFCSDNCREESSRLSNKVRRKKVNRKRINKDKRFRLNGKADYSINLDKLIDRDGLSCHICNLDVDRNDYVIREDGTWICGNDYPSLDHVIPISKGGLHQWDNIKLAHRVCNSRKSNKIL